MLLRLLTITSALFNAKSRRYSIRSPVGNILSLVFGSPSIFALSSTSISASLYRSALISSRLTKKSPSLLLSFLYILAKAVPVPPSKTKGPSNESSISLRLSSTIFEALKKEIELKGNKDFLIDSIFIGGGTPSFIDGKYIFDILEKLRENFTVLDNIEISIETNPKTFDEKKLEYYISAKINRLSIGVQSFNDKILKELGRNHNSKEALESIELVKKFGFDINLDLIFGYQSQTIEDILYDLEIVKKILGIIVLCITIPMGLIAMCYGQIISSILALIINTYYTGKLINVGFIKQMKDISGTLILSLIMFISIILLISTISSLLLELILGLSLGAIIYLGISKLLKFKELNYVLSIINRNR